MTTRRFGPYTVELTSLDRVLFPGAGYTKADLVDYYQGVAPAMLPYLRDRPLTLHRFPGGIEDEGFYQQNVGDGFPEWFPSVELPRKGGGDTVHALAPNAASLAVLANLGAITLHPWLSRYDRPDVPDRIVFDLDPPGDRFDLVRFAARELRALLEDELGLATAVMTSGSRGLHVWVPVRRDLGFDDVRAFARDVAQVLADRHPERLTVEARKANRGERLFLDTGRNTYGQTAVAPYAVRARPEAPVAAPIAWDELDDPDLHARSFTMATMPERLARTGDVWAGVGRRARRLEGAVKALVALDR